MVTEKKESDLFKYIAAGPIDEEWGIYLTTVGYQYIRPKGHYPLSAHPESYSFQPQIGRILNEYQLVYIAGGSGYFTSKYCPKIRIQAGTMILLFPGEWHTYYPDEETGWDEYWVGFKGINIDRRVKKKFFTPEEPLHEVGISSTVVGLYHEIIKYSEQEKAGFQQLISGIVLHILGLIYYRKLNNSFSNSNIVDKINEARIVMKANIENPVSPEKISQQLGLGYSWFRRSFKEYTGVSPARYQMQLRLTRAKELLIGSDKSISEIAYMLNYENAGQFSTAFKKHEGMTPSEFRNRNH